MKPKSVSETISITVKIDPEWNEVCDVSPNLSIQELREMLKAKFHISNDFKLRYKGEMLENDKTLSAYGITDKSLLSCESYKCHEFPVIITFSATGRILINCTSNMTRNDVFHLIRKHRAGVNEENYMLMVGGRKMNSNETLGSIGISNIDEIYVTTISKGGEGASSEMEEIEGPSIEEIKQGEVHKFATTGPEYRVVGIVVKKLASSSRGLINGLKFFILF